MIPRPLAPAWMLALFFAPLDANAQDVPPPPPISEAGASSATPGPSNAALVSDPFRASYMPYSSGHIYRSRTAPRQQPQQSNASDSYGFRNPGGVGRMNEFYPPGNQFPGGDHDQVSAAKFGSGSPDLSRGMQMQAERIGIAKTNSLNRQIEAYSRPARGFGFGLGFGGIPY